MFPERSGRERSGMLARGEAELTGYVRLQPERRPLPEIRGSAATPQLWRCSLLPRNYRTLTRRHMSVTTDQSAGRARSGPYPARRSADGRRAGELAAAPLALLVAHGAMRGPPAVAGDLAGQAVMGARERPQASTTPQPGPRLPEATGHSHSATWVGGMVRSATPSSSTCWMRRRAGTPLTPGRSRSRIGRGRACRPMPVFPPGRPPPARSGRGPRSGRGCPCRPLCR